MQQVSWKGKGPPLGAALSDPLGSVHLLPLHVTFVHPSLEPQDSEGSPMRETLPSSGHCQRYGLKTEVYPKTVTLDITTPPLTPSCWEGDKPSLQIRNGNKGGCPAQPSNPLRELCLRDLMLRPTCGCLSSLAYNRGQGVLTCPVRRIYIAGQDQVVVHDKKWCLQYIVR